MKSSNPKRIAGLRSLLATALFLAVPGQFAQAAATIVIQNSNAAGTGFNDPTPVAPIGGNVGTTLGQQRLIAFQYAANIWGATLTSSVPIVVDAAFIPLSCTATAAVLGSAGAVAVFSDFAGAAFAGTWYSFALANKLSGVNQASTLPQIRARFNVNLGIAGCLTGAPFYLGLDGNHGTAIDLVVVLLHEFGHGLGFQTFTNGSTGAQLVSRPSIWDYFLLDTATNKNWVNATAAERSASAIATNKLVWTGPIVTASAPTVLTPGTPYLGISGPNAGAAAGNYVVGTASFGALLSTTPVIGQLMPVTTQTSGTGPGCDLFNAANTLAVRGNVALIDRGTCGFTVKAKNAQLAGAIGVVIANNVAGSPPPGLGGSDGTINIPVVSVTLADATTLRAQLTRRSRTSSGVVAEVGINGAQLAGADPLGRLKMFTPNPFQGGSSVSHWDSSATRNLLMEPAINGDLTQSLIPPEDLTFRLLQDIGW